MKYIKLIALLLILETIIVNGQVVKRRNGVPFQGLRHFCSSRNKYAYNVNITGNTFTLTYDDFSIKGKFKDSLIFTNDPDEILYRKVGSKKLYGKYYIIESESISILNIENGDYSQYKRCDNK